MRLQRRQQCRHGDERAQMRGNSVAQFQSRQQRCCEAEVDPTIDQRDRGVDGGNGAEDAKQTESGQAGTRRGKGEQRRRKKHRRDKRNRRRRSRRRQATG